MPDWTGERASSVVRVAVTGVPVRRELSQMIALNFPELARAKNRDMKWKKFLYRELCQREGIYVCASPSCEACSDYAVCFGPEA